MMMIGPGLAVMHRTCGALVLDRPARQVAPVPSEGVAEKASRWSASQGFLGLGDRARDAKPRSRRAEVAWTSSDSRLVIHDHPRQGPKCSSLGIASD